MKIFTRQFYTRKKIIWGILIIVALAIGFMIFGGDGGPENIRTEVVTRQDLRQTVLSTGQVVSTVDLNLSFQSSGVVQRVLVEEGQRVTAGQTLSTLDQASVRASLTTAQGSLAQAQANYNKILSGASSEDVQVSQAAVDAAETALANAYSALLNSGLAAIPATGNTSGGTITITGTYSGTTEGEYRIAVEGPNFRVFDQGLETSPSTDTIKITRGVPFSIGTHGLYITFSSTGTFNTGDRWTIPIPNPQASTYLANLNAYGTAKQSLAQAEAALALKRAEARTPDLEAARAQVLSAQGQVATAQAAYNNTILKAPAAGTVTRVDIKAGEQAVASQPVMVLQDVGNLYVESDVSEADIASVQPDQPVDYTFDALGPDRHFSGTVRTVSPASTVISGIVNYKVTATVDDTSEIKPGMTANMTVLVAEKDEALAVSSTAVILKDGKRYVRVIDDPKTKTYHEVEVQTGLEADGGLIEILSGLSEGQEVVVDIQ